MYVLQILILAETKGHSAPKRVHHQGVRSVRFTSGCMLISLLCIILLSWMEVHVMGEAIPFVLLTRVTA